jgi:hypothetical protein
MAIVGATYLLVKGRSGSAGALLGVITWFKLWPIAFLGYFLVKRQFKAAAGFLIASLAALGLGHLAFGLDRFLIFNPSISTEILHKQFILSRLIMPPQPSIFHSDAGGWHGTGFCGIWYAAEQTAVGVQWAVCRLAFSHRWLSGWLLFYGLVAAAGVCGCLGLFLFERLINLSPQERQWSIIYEISLVTCAGAFVLNAHYYYFVYLTLPLSVLAHEYAQARAWSKLGALTLAYLLLGAFLLPFSLMSRLFGVNFWEFYLDHVLYLYGFLILVALLLREYVTIGLRGPHRSLLGAPDRQLARGIAQ